MNGQIYFDRDLSWLAFNERVLAEAGKDTVPLLERITFLAIYSSNLDEFYRVRIPAMMLPHVIQPVKGYATMHTTSSSLYRQATERINKQQEQFGHIVTQQVVPALKAKQIYIVYNETIPAAIHQQIKHYFYTQLLSFIRIVKPAEQTNFFPENNKLYIAVLLQQADADAVAIVNIPSDSVSRFVSIKQDGIQYVVFIDDIIKEHMSFLFVSAEIKGMYSFKITRDAELDLQDEYEGDIADKIEIQVKKRDLGFATRFLYQPGIPFVTLQMIIGYFNMHNASVVEGGRYHNLRDLLGFPVKDTSLQYELWKQVLLTQLLTPNIFTLISQKDIILHTPYHDYGLVLRFFNEAATDEDVTEVYTTLYRVAGDSKIANALCSAAQNGKKVAVFVELKARFDEANNLKWAKRMKDAGVKIIYSIPGLKVHAKVALVKRKDNLRVHSYGLFSTGNLNESTAKVYTDHILFTTHAGMLRELELLFIFLSRRRKPFANNEIQFNHLLVAQFNLQQHFITLIEREIVHAKQGLPAAITIKFNNIEERVLINKLYEASQAGVQVNIIARSICCLVPQQPGLSDNIQVSRIVDRYLEHGRVFIFYNNGKNDMYLGSADWMNRNIYRRIEVCFPVYDETIKQELQTIVNIQFRDNVQAVNISNDLENIPKVIEVEAVRSQEEIYKFLSAKQTT